VGSDFPLYRVNDGALNFLVAQPLRFVAQKGHACLLHLNHHFFSLACAVHTDFLRMSLIHRLIPSFWVPGMVSQKHYHYCVSEVDVVDHPFFLRVGPGHGMWPAGNWLAPGLIPSAGARSQPSCFQTLFILLCLIFDCLHCLLH